MKNIIIATAVIAALGIGWWLISPLFIDKTVEEELSPDIEAALNLIESEQTDEPKIDEEQMEVVITLSEQVKEDMKENFMKEMMDQQEKKMTDPEPDMISEEGRGPREISSGSFVDVAHQGSGVARLIDTGDETILRFEDFDVLNGPDLRVLLSKNTGIAASEDLGDYIEVGKLKGNKGNQNYVLSDNIDVSEYHSVVIYCKPFHVVFNSADLK